MQLLAEGKYFGQSRAEVRLSCGSISQYDYNVQQTGWHYHENPYFMYVLSGKMIDGSKRGSILCPTGSLMLNNWQEAHYNEKHTPSAGGFHLELDRSWMKNLGVKFSFLEGNQKITDPRIHLLFAKLYYEFRQADQFSAIAIKSLIFQICDALNTSNNQEKIATPSWLNTVIEILHDKTEDISLQYLANQIGVHPIYLSRAIPQHLGVGLGEYLRILKLQRALPRLIEQTEKLSQVAYGAGFSDQSHLNRVFKQYFKMSPGKYRKSLRNFS